MWVRSCLFAVAALLALAGCATIAPQPERLSWGQVHTFSDGTTVRVNAPTVWADEHCVNYDWSADYCRDSEPHRALKVAVTVTNLDQSTRGGRIATATVGGVPAVDLYPGHVELAHLDGPVPAGRMGVQEAVFIAPSREVDVTVEWRHNGQSVVFAGSVPTTAEVAS